MSGKPAARQGDGTMKGGPIIQGSAGVIIGAPTGVACSVCPGGMTSGNPVNPLLGAKVQPGETDFVLPGPLPFVLSRTYSSYRTKTPAPVGIFGPGWKAPFDIRLQLRDEELILNDNGGRGIHFDPLFAGETAFSRSESFWLARGGVSKLHESNPLHRLWQQLPQNIRTSPHVYLATNSLQGPWWVLGWSERVPAPDDVLPAPLPPYRVLTGLVDNFGHAMIFHRAASGEFAGEITAVTDGAGRRFRLVLTTQAQRAAQYLKLATATKQSVPETLSATDYGTDSGIRLAEVWLTHDPEYPDNLPATPLARYDYTPRGELAMVYDRSGTAVHGFTCDAKHPGRMVAHRYAGRPEIQYRYDASGRVTEQRNPEGLSYAYVYDKNTVTITDSLNRREVLHTEGEGGMKRVVKKEQADGSATHSDYDSAGRLLAQTDAAGRKTEYRLSPGSGQLKEIITPDGRRTELYYNSQRQLTSTVYPDGLQSQQEYDDHGRLTTETGRNGSTTRYFYETPRSEYPCATEDATGSRKEMVWSRYGQLLTFTDCSGYETRYEYDRFGQLTAVHQEEGISLYRTYDNRGRLTAIKDAQGLETRYEYNAAGDLTTVIAPDGSRSDTTYDAWGHILSATQDGLTRQMAYDAAGRVTQLTNENGSHTVFTYDALDRLTQETGFDGRTQRYCYSAAGQLIRSEDESLVTRWYYDEADRLTHRTVNDEPAEQWRYSERGWLTEISHLSDGHRVTVHYGHDKQGRLISEHQTVHHPETGELLWQHDTRYDYSDKGLQNRVTSDALPPVEWLTYGSGYLAGMKLGDVPLMDFSRDRLHRETQRSFGDYDLTTAYTPGGQLQSHHLTSPQLNRDYTWNNAGQLVRISGVHEQRDYQYGAAGRLVSTQIKSASRTLEQWTPTDPAGNRIAERDKFPMLPDSFRDNRIGQDVDNFYHHDEHGRLVEKAERRLHPHGSLSHHYGYDNQHRLAHYRLVQHGGDLLTESRYIYDPLGRRIGKRVWNSQEGRDSNGDRCLWLNPAPEVTWYGWDGDRLTTTQTDATRIQTVYLPGSFTPLLRVETGTGELTKAIRRTLAEKLQQDAGMAFVPELVAMLDNLERELKTGQVSEQSQQWLAQCGLTPEQMKNQMEPEYTPQRKIHLYHCDHRGLPLALIDVRGRKAWSAEFDEWGNVLREDNPDNLQQLLRLPGQQWDKETGLYYNRHRYFDPVQGRYITQDPIGLRGGWNPYQYPLNPVAEVDPLGQKGMRSDGHPWGYGCGDESTDRLVPDSLGAANFLPACRNHDICYGTLDSDKATCDKGLGADMKLACKNDLKGLHTLYSPLCNGMAGGYEFAVREFGQSAYDAAQEKALNNYMEFEMLNLLQSMGENVNPDEYKQAHDRVVNPN
ncbi:RHS element core protein [Salmonella enterica subsp. indica]|uniref:RHS element core protein n=1 Tax=Salmonella enterica TaxID=28901 RepID=UPI00159028F3|nr:RHS element core protein [Salmonella enterica]HBC0059327.1 RHS domain-containing protein [Salmonella enterica]HCL5303278.1 RHS domain-containing protein [Salmonella enterica]